ncbi:MAG TPA: DUF2092 domain-containing protein [Pirellulales bacterium]|nr:DUF2092 domain-containing protein [Pirellulales bacterium]
MRFSALLALLATLAVDHFPSTAVAAPKSGKPASADKLADAKAVLKRVATFYRQKKSFEVDFSQKTSISLGGAKNTLESQAKISAERPNRLAMRQKGAAAGMDVVCDGDKLSVSIPLLKQYTQGEAPKSLDELLTNPLVMGGMAGRGPLLDVFSDDPYKTLMDGVTKDDYAGREKIGDTEAHHLKFEQDQFHWELCCKPPST